MGEKSFHSNTSIKKWPEILPNTLVQKSSLEYKHNFDSLNTPLGRIQITCAHTHSAPPTSPISSYNQQNKMFYSNHAHPFHLHKNDGLNSLWKHKNIIRAEISQNK